MMTLLPLAPERASRLVSAFPTTHVLVIGDAMLDTFLVGRVTRISPEAPVPVIAFQEQTHRIGGAANVAHNITALGGHATLIGVIGQDDNGKTLTRGCREAGIEAGFLAADSDRVTTTKVRIVTERNQQVARVDYESDTDISGDAEQGIITSIHQNGADASAIVVSDYLKGCITRRVIAAAVELAGQRNIPLLVDPKIPHIDYYAGATVITPNHQEAETATHMRIRSSEEARIAARAFRDRARCGAVLITRGDHGMWLLGPDTEGHLPAAAREVADVTGAGDTVIATMGLVLAAGGTFVEAAQLANAAAGLAVAKFGAATLAPGELLGGVSISAEH
jgi:D-beta-D-heptose 7-phosphate kinase/D-beta-D-heptose 1-phosphate adenosyltransferase